MNVELELRKGLLKSGKQAIVLRIINNRKVKRKNTGFSVFEKDWDNSKKQVRKSHPNYQELNIQLQNEVNKVEKLAITIIGSGSGDADTVIAAAYAKHDFVDFIKGRLKTFIDNGQYAYAKKTNTIIGLLEDFSPNVAINEINPAYLTKFRNKRKEAGKKPNTIISNLSMIRTFYREALIATRYRPDVDPFDEFTVGMFKPATKAVLNQEEVNKLYSFSGNQQQNIAKDVWLTSFYLAGARFGDILRLKWTDIEQGRAIIKPTKTRLSSGVELNMPIHPKLAKIFDRYDKKTETIFNVIREGDAYDIDRLNANLGKTLKLVLLGAGIAKNISYSCARNTFAQLANEISGRDIYSIRTALGHTKMATTEIYLGTDKKAVDELMKKVYG